MRAVAVGVALVACSGPDDTTDSTTLPDEQGVAVGVRTVDGDAPVSGETDELRVYVGSANPAVPDAAGFAFFFNATPDRLPVSADLEGEAGAFAAPEVRPEGLSGASLVTLPLAATVDVDDAASDGRLDGDGFRVDVPGKALGLDEVEVAGPYVLMGHRVREADRAAAPQVQIAIRNDVELVPIAVHELVVARAWQEGERLRVLPDQQLTVTVEVDPASPLFAPGATVVAWILSTSTGYWTGAGAVTVDTAAATVTFEPGVIGWWALGLENPVRGCVTGRLVDPDGRGVTGVGLRSSEVGLLGIDGASALDGTFCMPVSPGAVAEIRAIGFSPDRSALYVWSDTVTGSAAGACGQTACTDVGEVVMQAWRDSDGDRYWDGPGGDCDDRDPAVNPTVAFGDASYCGGAL